MAINFDALPSSAPSNVLEAGKYRAKIIKAEMRVPKSNPSAPPYLSMTCEMKDSKGKSCGKFWDSLYDSDKDLLRYKLQRFITAMRIPIEGEFELKDLLKVIQGKELVMDISVTTNKQTGKEQSGVNVFGDAYYPIQEWAALCGDYATAPEGEDLPFTMDDPKAPINAADAEDAAGAEDEDY